MGKFATFLVLLLAMLLGLTFREVEGTIVIDRQLETATTVEGVNLSAFDLFRKLGTRPGNVALSPTSVSNALALAHEGAKGETAAQMARALHLPADPATLRRGFRELNARLNGDGSPRDYRLASANSLWGQVGHPFLPGYIKVAAEDFGAGMNSVDFAAGPESARRAINAWVDGKTEHKIPDLLGSGDVDRQTSLVLVNAVYFKADWARPFEASATHPAPFHRANGSPIRVPTMNQSGRMGFVQEDGFSALELPYKGNELAMLVVLPDEGVSLDRVEAKFDAAAVASSVSRLAPKRVELSLPKFKLTTKAELSPVLQDLGMVLAFGDDADFSGMDGTRQLHVSAVVHQVVVEVNEKGTEAAAATAAVMRALSAMQVEKPVVFRVDRPFLYLIREAKTGAILFLGRVADPSS